MDTLDIDVDRHRTMFSEKNAARIARQQQAEITVIIGNPPYNARQLNENDNNKNRVYPVTDNQVRETYSRDSKATNRNALSDMYVKFFRWATDRLGDRDGIVCFVSNNAFVDGAAFDGMRKHLPQEFTHIYHLDLGGNARKNGGGSVFHIMVGVGITLMVRKRSAKQQSLEASIWYHAVDETLSGREKLVLLRQWKNYRAVDWNALQPNEKYVWLTEGLRSEFKTFLPMGIKAVKSEKPDTHTIFQAYSIGIGTSRDAWMYDFDKVKLVHKATHMIETYHNELSRWIRAGSPIDIDNFVLTDNTKIKWSSRLKEYFARKVETTFQESNIRYALYRPFTRQYLYFDSIMTHRRGVFPYILPTPTTETENIVLIVSDHGHRTPFSVLISNILPDLHVIATNDAFQCFPFYTYDLDGTNRQENITDWALQQFQAVCGAHITKWDIFYYIYAVLHHPIYREHYTENLKRDLPRIPLPSGAEAFTTLAAHGKALADLHIGYEQVAEYQKLKSQRTADRPVSWRVEKMKLSQDKKSIIVNPTLALHGIPPECFEYRLGTRSALEWVIDQYQVKTDKRSGIVNDPNREDDPEYIVRLVRRVVIVSVETVRIVGEIAKVDMGVGAESNGNP